MWNKIRGSLPLQLMLAALAAWLLATGISQFSAADTLANIHQQSWFQFLMLGKTVYIGLLKMVVGYYGYALFDRGDKQYWCDNQIKNPW
ncbi:hypothetical protein [Shewanella halifaxensis]|uniref:hypothetical protein n=1 Tax=Shewanella halifaxensis TaxID=271098 RepID=UPI001F2F47F4|nr:hypothetical protein [Shewanella halifaxensis]